MVSIPTEMSYIISDTRLKTKTIITCNGVYHAVNWITVDIIKSNFLNSPNSIRNCLSSLLSDVVPQVFESSSLSKCFYSVTVIYT